ncbi:MAG TPA: YigZ family protein [Cellvibrionaceae bacterium]
MMRTYTALAAPAHYCHEQKRSTFTALLTPINSREQAMQAVSRARNQQPGASHYCWAYLLGAADQPRNAAFSDDGEPGGTAGKPMLGVLQHRGAGDCVAVVVRTFGGVKLGAGGLVRAYGAAVSGALDAAQLRDITPTVPVSVEVGFALEERVRHALSGFGMTVEQAAYAERVTLHLLVPFTEVQTLQQHLQQITAGDLGWHDSF